MTLKFKKEVKAMTKAVRVGQFVVTISDADLKRLRRMLDAANVPDVDCMSDEEVLTGVFYVDFGTYGELDLRNRVKVRRAAGEPTVKPVTLERRKATRAERERLLQQLKR